MKKLLVCFSLFILHFSFSNAQDTIVLRNGQKMAVKVVSFGNEIIYSMPPADQQMSIKVSRVSYIKYADGTVSKINNADFNPSDTVKMKLKPYIVFSGGASLPLDASGYGATTFNTDQENIQEYSGYAYHGSAFSITAGLGIYEGWEVTAIFSSIRNGFNASAVMFETNYDFIHRVFEINAIGSYYYNNYSCLLGVTKNWKNKYVSFGISIMAGELITYIPAMYGAGQYYPNSSSANPAANCYVNLSSESQQNFDVELGIHGDIKVTQHIFLRGQLEFQFSGITYGGNYQITDAVTGNTVSSTQYDTYDLFFGLLDVTAGLGYKF